MTGVQTCALPIYAPDGTASDVVKTEAASDGTWSTDLDLAALITSIGSSTATTTDGWTIGAGCMTYGGKTETAQPTAQQQTQIFFDDTRISGSYEVSARAEHRSQTFTFNVQGFHAGETVTILLKNKSDSSICYTLGELTVDANGDLVGNLPAPTDAANGEYVLVLTGSHHSETAASQTMTTVSDHTFTIENSQRSTTESETTENSSGGSSATSGGETQTNGGGETQASSSATSGGETKASGGANNSGGSNANSGRDNQASGGEPQSNGGETKASGSANNSSDSNANSGRDNQASGGGEAQANSRANSGGNNAATDQKVNNQVARDKGVSQGAKDSSSDTRAAGETKTGASDRSLAHTGANGMIFGGIAALLVVVGGAILFLRRRSKA